MFELTRDQKNILEQRLRKTRDISERNRICVILGHAEGRTIDELSKVLRISHATVCNYLSDFDSDFIKTPGIYHIPQSERDY